ncbi:hypothetical protein NL108_012321 [Boleophthalmus pectinirostris]|uniref:tyrosine-protein phosphatase non-receptor type 22 n=1 Tax=Boleophthalmus pectinirostris TaxID=150288 RepID=UPI000A1C26CC|nr:tyrosine-protein phosphatase non-receptor type 22 [Boleophthalmus pectinirostris]KAJ0064711.1 hypothetical protein NL108_012321 [Boleophthalmus pectinirostris]
MVEQAWVLRSLLEELQTEEDEDQEAPNGIFAQFTRLRNQSMKYRSERTFTTKSAEKSDNIKKNRYKDIIPFDHSRVKLTFTTSKNDTDYINANFIKGVSGSRAYIATQGPLPHTVLDFLRMLWEYNIKVVVMACREFEMGKKKCECYWPKEQDAPYVCEPFTIYCDSEKNKGDYVTRTLRVNYRDCSRTLKQLHYVNWPDHGVPDSIPPILDMLQEMRSYQDHDDTPICIHCSAGCGRTGVLCVIDYTWNLLKNQMIRPDFNIFELVQNMRTQRPSVVQTKEQYVLVYRTIKLLFERYLESEESLEQESEVDAEEVLAELGSGYDMNEDLNDLETQLQHLLETAAHPPPSEHVYRNQTETNHLWQHHDDLQVTSFFSEIPQSTSPQELNLLTEPEPEERKGGWIEERVDERREERRDSETIETMAPRPSSSTATMCLTVEDPYFDSPTEEPSPHPWSSSGTPSLSLNDQPVEVFTCNDSGTLDVHSDDEIPPPLPERTPESFEIPENTEPCVRLSVVIPPNAAAAAVRELTGSSTGSSPPSPAPPLPERTPESFELAIDPSPSEENIEPTPPVNLNLLGVSSEWSGSSGAGVDHNETKTWSRSKSLRAKMTFSEFTQPKQTSNTSSKPPRRPLELPPPPPPPGHPLPAVSPPLTQDNTHGLNRLGPPLLEIVPPTQSVGIFSEQNGPAQSKSFLDVVMNRSKSVRVKGSFREPPAASRSRTPPPAAAAALETTTHTNADEGHAVNNKLLSAGAEVSEKSMSRSKSLKFFRGKHKTKLEPPPSQPSTPPPSYESLTSFFKFGFGTRFSKPKGPRRYPETWV